MNHTRHEHLLITAPRAQLVLTLFALSLAGCSGDDGASGTGGTGSTGGTGGTGTSTATGTTSSTSGSTSTSTSTSATGSGSSTGDTGTGDTGTGDTGTGDTGTGGVGTGTGGVGIEIAGQYTDEFGGMHAITDTEWFSDFGGGATATFHIMDFDNAGNWAAAQNDAGNAFNPGDFSRFDWTEFGGALWYCQTVFDAATLQDAKDAAPADPTDPSMGGCGTFPWTNLTP